MPDLSRRAVEELAVELTGRPARERSAMRRDFAALHGCSLSTLSRHLHKSGLRSHTRRDRGISRTGISDEQLATVKALQTTSESLRKGIVMPARVALEIAEHNGITTEPLSVSTYNAWLRRHSATRVDQVAETPHIELRSLGPNHVHQVDFSLAVNWKVENNAPMYEHMIYKNKLPAAGVPRIWRLIVVDHSTGCFFPHYSISAGETVQALLEGLYRAWAEKTANGESIKSRYPFRGVPRILMADRGSTTKAGATIALLNRLGVKLNICEGARSKGTVEVSHRFWEERFETRLRLQQPKSIEQMNAWAVELAAEINATERHSRHGSERSTLWSWHIGRKPETQLRELRCSFEAFKSIALTDAQKCRVGGSRIIRFRSQKYRVPECFSPNSWVQVQFSPFDFPQIQVQPLDEHNAPAYLCSPVEVDEMGFAVTAATIGLEYKAVKATPAGAFASDSKRRAKELIDSNKVEAFGYHLNRTPEIGVPTEGIELPVAAQAAAVMTRVTARAQVIEMLGRALSPAEAAHVNRMFGERVTDAEIAAAVTEIQRGIGARVLEFASGQK